MAPDLPQTASTPFPIGEDEEDSRRGGTPIPGGRGRKRAVFQSDSPQARAPIMRRAVRRHRRTAQPVLPPTGLPHAAHPTGPRHPQEIGPPVQLAGRTKAEGRRIQDDAGGVRRPRIRATTVSARARRKTSMPSLYHDRKPGQTCTERSIYDCTSIRALPVCLTDRPRRAS